GTLGFSGTGVTLSRYTASGSLDGSFGVGGRTISLVSGPVDAFAFDLLVQPDGKAVAVGYAGADLALARYNPDGSRDPTFGNAGRVTTDFGFTFDTAMTAVLQGDGKMVVAGSAIGFRRTFSDGPFAVARYNPDGTLDVGFGAGGLAFVDFDDPQFPDSPG